MEQDELEAMIPSETVRQYVLETGWIFTDWQRAALLAHSWRPVEDRLSLLRRLSGQTSDEELRRQIAVYVDWVEQVIRELQDNRDRRCVYVLKLEDEDNGDDYRCITPGAYFFDWETACECGRKSGGRFEIEKYRVADCPDTGESYAVSGANFDRDGRIDYLSREFYRTEDDFTRTFFLLPNPFERGDIVRRVSPTCGPDDYGIVETSQKQVREFHERLKSGNHLLPPQFEDDNLRVEFLNDDGTFSHDHVLPLHLERYEPEWGPDNTAEGTRDDLLLVASMLYKGDGALDELGYYVMKYRNVREK